MTFLTSSTIFSFVLLLANTLGALTPEPSLTVASFHARSLSSEQLPLFTEYLLTTDADVLCLQEFFDESAVAFLYENLEEQYPYFYLSPPSLTCPLLIVSKYPIEYAHFSTLSQGREARGVLFDGGISRNGLLICHFYAAHFDPEIEEWQQQMVLQKMEEDCIALGDEMLPYFLCGDMKRDRALLLRTLSSIPLQEISQGTTLESFAFSSSSNPDLSGVIATLFPREERDLSILLCKGRVGVGAEVGKDKDGNEYVEGKVTGTVESEDGNKKFEIEITGDVSKDSDGKTHSSGSVTAKAGMDF